MIGPDMTEHDVGLWAEAPDVRNKILQLLEDYMEDEEKRDELLLSEPSSELLWEEEALDAVNECITDGYHFEITDEGDLVLVESEE